MDTLTGTIALLIVAATIKKVVDLAKYVKANDMNGVVTQVLAWLVGVGGAFLLAWSDFGHQSIQGITLSSYNAGSLIIFGLVLGSGGSTIKDIIAGFDNTQTAIVPSLLQTTTEGGS